MNKITIPVMLYGRCDMCRENVKCLLEEASRPDTDYAYQPYHTECPLCCGGNVSLSFIKPKEGKWLKRK